MAKPTIQLTASSNMNFDATGGTRDIQVTYTDTTDALINAPLFPVDAVDVTLKSKSMANANMFVFTYTVKVYAHSYRRSIPILFSAHNPDDGKAGNYVGVIVQGTDTQKEAGVGAYVVPDTTYGLIPATGGDVFVMITMSYPQSDTPLSAKPRNFNGVYPISWATATLMGGGVDDDGTEGDETWKITIRPNTSDVGWGAAVGFSYTNTYNEQGGNTVYVVQEAGDMPVEELEPSVEAYATILKYDKDGKNAIQTSNDYVNVMYNHITTSQIQDAVITPSSTSWLQITDSVVMSNTTEGVLMRYMLECSPNTGDVRTCAINYSAVVDGVTYTASTNVTQARYEADEEDDGDTPTPPSTGDDSDEVYVGAIWKDIEYDFAVEDAEYSIEYDGNVIFKGRSVRRPNTRSNKVCINKVCQNYMENTILKEDGAVSSGYDIKPFILKNEYGTILCSYYFLNDWSYTNKLRNGLLSSPILNERKVYRGQWTPFTVSALGDERVTLKYGVVYDKNATDEYGTLLGSWDNTEYVKNGVVTDYFIVSRRDIDKIDNIYIGPNVWKMEGVCACQWVVYYVNPWGGFDWMPIKGRVVETDNLTAYNITQNYKSGTIDFGRKRYLTEINKMFQLNTGWLSKEESDRMWYLTESNTVYLHNLETNQMYSVVIKDTTFEHKERTKLSSRIKYTINVETSQTFERI